MHSTGNFLDESKAYPMSLLLGLETSNVVRLVDNASVRVTSSRQPVRLRQSKKSRLVFLTDPTGLAVEQYKILRRRLINLHPNGGAVLVTSPSPGEGKTLTSINLAWSLAAAGHRTCLVDLDFRAPGVAPTLGYSVEEDGIEDVLTGRRTITQSIRQLEDCSLYVLGVRKRLITPGELLSSSSLTPLLADLRAMFQWIILDFAPIIPMADVPEVVANVDGALMVIRSGKTDKSMVIPGVEILGSKLWGVVLNDSPISGSSYYGNYGNRRD
jgi:capsular exopolysaccharide synthesis family protein